MLHHFIIAHKQIHYIKSAIFLFYVFPASEGSHSELILSVVAYASVFGIMPVFLNAT